MIGQTFGMLTVVERTVYPKRFCSEAHRAQSWWRCRCECGGEKIASGPDLRGGHPKSCGCNRDGFTKAARDAQKAKHALTPLKIKQVQKMLLDGKSDRATAAATGVYQKRVADIRAKMGLAIYWPPRQRLAA